MKTYYALPYGQLIDKHTELLGVCSIRNPVYKKHPHYGKRVYISRRALKHFVESRKAELGRYHSAGETLENIYFAIDSTQETIINFDLYEDCFPKYLFTKDYSDIDKSQIRVILEVKNNRLEILSIHFKKKGK
ncbi:MAG: hypothetical protein JWM92_339 [Candidatus Nomurabacteria bacterium]|nr:hypothetical protein [Candidatus Nomurabacteria bacterium]